MSIDLLHLWAQMGVFAKFIVFVMSLVVCTVLYIALSAVMTGMAPWKNLGTPDPMSLRVPVPKRDSSRA